MHAITCIHHTDAEREALPVFGNCPVCAARQLTAAQKELSELRADKARLDWLQSQWRVTSFIPNGEFLADHLRASIDDAMMRTIDYTPKCP